MDAAIPWEDTSARFFDRLWTTVWMATTDPIGTFARLAARDDERDIAAGVRFTLVVSIIGWAPLLLLAPCLALIPIAFAAALPDRVREIGIGVSIALILSLPMVFVAASVGYELLYGLFFHLIARLAGGVGDLRGSMHAMLYTAAIRFWLCPGTLLGFVPFIGTMISVLLRVAFMVWGGFACFGAARSLHKLGDNPALVVAILTPLLSTALVSFVVALGAFGLFTVLAGTISLADILGHGPR